MCKIVFLTLFWLYLFSPVSAVWVVLSGTFCLLCAGFFRPGGQSCVSLTVWTFVFFVLCFRLVGISE